MPVLLIIEKKKPKQIANGKLIVLYESLNCHLTPLLVFIFEVHKRSL